MQREMASIENLTAAAMMELIKNMTELEREVDKPMPQPKVFEEALIKTNDQLNFMQDMNFIHIIKANALREEIKKTKDRFEQLERAETMDVVNDHENPRERARRYQNMDYYNLQILQERTKSEKQNKDTVLGNKEEERSR